MTTTLLTPARSALEAHALDQLFRDARTHNAWLPLPVGGDVLRQLYDLMKWAPTSANASPARFVFLRTPEARARLVPALAPGNVERGEDRHRAGDRDRGLRPEVLREDGPPLRVGLHAGVGQRRRRPPRAARPSAAAASSKAWKPCSKTRSAQPGPR